MRVYSPINLRAGDGLENLHRSAERDKTICRLFAPVMTTNQELWSKCLSTLVGRYAGMVGSYALLFGLSTMASGGR